MNAPTKVVPQRVLAFVIDWVLGIGLWFVMVTALGEQFDVPGADAGFEMETIGDATFIRVGETAWALDGGKFGVVALVVLAWWVFNLVILTGTIGASIGKLICGIRVVREDGRVCGIGKAIVRWLLLIVDSFPYFVPLVGFVMALATDGNRRLGDMAAGTYVVKRAAVGTPVGSATQPGYGTYGAAPPPGYPPPGGGFSGPPTPDSQWDAERGTWRRWDGQAWVGLDTSTGTWRRL